MKLRSLLLLTTSTIALAGSVASGCNALLGNEEGSLRVSAADGGDPTRSGPGIEAGAPAACDTSSGSKLCFGLCVKIDQVATGCGDPSSCEACDPKNTEGVICKGSKTSFECAYGACAPGYESCDGIPSNGCEASLNRPETCGACSATCSADGGAPLCAPADGGYACTDTCPGSTTECRGACVDVTSSVEHCGGCGNQCVRKGATARCEERVCKYTCVSGTHDCDGTCASDSAPATCGKSCTPCTGASPSRHQVNTCDDGHCGVACEPGWLDCTSNGFADDGCETEGNSCPLVTPCGALVCVAGQKCCKDRCVDENVACAVPPANE